MGTDCKIYLPSNVQVDYVASAIGVLSGLKPKKKYFDKQHDGWAVDVPGVGVENTTTSVSMVNIMISHPNMSMPLVDGEYSHHVRYFFEGTDPDGKPCRTLMPRSTAYWISIGRGLLKLFGGKIDYNDCDDIEINEKLPPWKHSSAEDGEPWYALQNRILNIKPLTEKDLIDNDKHAAYPR